VPRNGKKPVLICPAQFCIPEDYEEMVLGLQERGHSTYVADLKRLDWLKIVPSALTPDYWTGNLKPNDCLHFFYEKLDSTFKKIKEEHPGQPIHLIGHSIGGWIVRAYLGEVCDPNEIELFCSLTTLGSPQRTPPEGTVWEQLDQTRGLLSYVNKNFPGVYHKHIKYTSVAGESTEGLLDGNLENMVAFASYLSLCGDGYVKGDGIVPVESALLEGADRILIQETKHAGFLPTPGASIKLTSYKWYGSPSVIEQWASVLD